MKEVETNIRARNLAEFWICLNANQFARLQVTEDLAGNDSETGPQVERVQVIVKILAHQRSFVALISAQPDLQLLQGLNSASARVNLQAATFDGLTNQRRAESSSNSAVDEVIKLLLHVYAPQTKSFPGSLEGVSQIL